MVVLILHLGPLFVFQFIVHCLPLQHLEEVSDPWPSDAPRCRTAIGSVLREYATLRVSRLFSGRCKVTVVIATAAAVLYSSFAR